MHKYTFIIWIIGVLAVFSQVDPGGNQSMEFRNNLLKEIVLDGNVYNHNEYMSYFLLKRRVLKVYPYVDSVLHILGTADSHLDLKLKKRQSRRLIRKLQKKTVNNFRENIVNLTRKEGVILCKLIYRELNRSVYDLIYSYRGRFNAFFWQTMAKLWNNDLKTIYDPSGVREDYLIENIINEEKLYLQKSL